MPLSNEQILRFITSVHPYDALPAEKQAEIARAVEVCELPAGAQIYRFGEEMAGLYIIYDGRVEVTDANGELVSHLGLRNSFGERGLSRDGRAATSARTLSDAVLLLLPAALFHALIEAHRTVARFFDRSRTSTTEEAAQSDLTTVTVETLMATTPITCPPDCTAVTAARTMRDHKISSLCVTRPEDKLVGIVTTRDLSGKVLAEALPPETPVSDVMTPDPVHLSPAAIGSDVLHQMMERRIGHIPIVEAGKLVGIVSQSDLTRFQAVSSAELAGEIASAQTAEEMATITARIPRLLVSLVAAGNRHEVVTRLITDIADTVTRRLLTLAGEKLGPPPVPYLWLACGSQGRQEQTGVSDQDNCLMLDDAVTEADMDYFRALAKFVSDGLDVTGYFYCPGDMMATNPRWCQPVRVWRDYFARWIRKPDPEAQMLASVMFDLRPIGGHRALFEDLQEETLAAAAKNSIFVAHMVSNSLKHMPPLGLLRGLATIRSGEHKNQIDMKLNGVVPVVDLGRIYALQGKLTEVNTRARLVAAAHAGVLSASGAADLIDAYDLIARTRLEHQAARVKKGQKPDNYLAPAALSDFDRSHLRDAFVVIKTLQSAVGHGKGALG
ncbi:MAG: histidine kinase [Rhodobacterales bacterium]|nr:MAG: histidine kinase [Rhodobacterales bacterium]